MQGVGFRPFVHRLATGLGLTGVVGNDADGVFIEVEGAGETIERFARALRDEPPPLAVITSVDREAIEPRGDPTFAIVESVGSESPSTLVAPDAGPCGECLDELGDPDDRRAGYPFLNCTNCGPRFTIVRGVPYDRPLTTMADFELCERCRAEYDDPGDRRFHAQPTCCPDCGPRLRLLDDRGRPVDVADVVAAVDGLIGAGRIVAVKGVGGYHLAVDARLDDAVGRLRERKHREEKPFALLVADVAAARELVDVSPAEADLLVSPERPIVLLDRRPDRPDAVAPSVAPGNGALGIMLPPSPLHARLADARGAPLVMTSGNRRDEPIVAADDLVVGVLGGIADAFCSHDRPIHARIDDSVVRVVAGRPLPVRRARGHVPRPVHSPVVFDRHVLAVGAQLKNTVALGRDAQVFVSAHLGDLENHETFVAFAEAIDHLGRLFDVRPEVVAHDLHPDMMSTAHARSLTDLEPVGVQHHHAHIASCLADNRKARDVIGVAFDGLGYGSDGTIWGGEVLRADLRSFERIGHLDTVPMPGGDAAVREPWRIAAMHLERTVDRAALERLDVWSRNRSRWDAVASLGRSGVAAPLTSSMGRLFDAVAAIVGVRDVISYEGQAAIELEQIAERRAVDPYPVVVSDATPFVIGTRGLIEAVIADVVAGVAPATIAARFHTSIVQLIGASCAVARDRTGLDHVALSGGVFQNARIVQGAVDQLSRDGFTVLSHRQVPPNDAGISLGQAVVAAGR